MDEVPVCDACGLVHAWGYQVGSTWVELPKLPLIRAGLSVPPFVVERPDGSLRHVVERGCGQ